MTEINLRDKPDILIQDHIPKLKKRLAKLNLQELYKYRRSFIRSDELYKVVDSPDEDFDAFLEFLLELNIDPNLNSESSTRFSSASPLFFASFHDRENAVKLLVDYKADINSRPTPLLIAIEKKYNNIAKFLLEQTNVNINFGFHLAAKVNNLEMLKHFLNVTNLVRGVDERSSLSKHTALHMAAANGCVQAIEYLFEQGAEIESRNFYGQNPLWLAITNNQYEAMKELLSLGANPNFKLDNVTTMQAAIHARCKKMVTLLLRYKRTVEKQEVEDAKNVMEEDARLNRMTDIRLRHIYSMLKEKFYTQQQ